MNTCRLFGFATVALSLATTLAEDGISIFAVSTYDTDYLMVRAADLENAVRALREAGNSVTE